MYAHLVFSPLILGPGQERPLYVLVLSHGCLGPQPSALVIKVQTMPTEITPAPRCLCVLLLSPFSS